MMIYVIMGVTMLVSFLVSWRLKSKFKQYSQIPLASGMSGQEIATKMLQDHGIYDVKVISVQGQLTDHYNPMNKTVNLSHDVFYGRHAAAAAVAAHECGHAVQHATAYSMLTLRSKMVPFQSASAQVLSIVMMVVMIGGFAVFKSLGAMTPVLLVIIAANLVVTLFAAITLPVEFDASRRALAWINSKGIVTQSEHAMSKDALTWAALTYVVVALGSLAQLLYYVSLLLNRRD